MDLSCCLNEEVSTEEVQRLKKTGSVAEVTDLDSADKRLQNCSKQMDVVKQPVLQGDCDESVFFYCGNPYVGRTKGIIHFHERREAFQPMSSSEEDFSILCMLRVPSTLNCPVLLRFISLSLQDISMMRILQDDTINQYMVVMKFLTTAKAEEFYEEYNGVEFNGLEPEICVLVFVKRMELLLDGDKNVPFQFYIELPACTVCLERVEDDVLTILCNHTFHARCLEKWTDTTCPVCRYYATPDVVGDQRCITCGRSTDLWICLTCGNVGCGRYSLGHGEMHFKATTHTFALKVGTERVWDYAGDNYVHRLINGPDGKVIEYQRTQNETEGEEKIESMQLEFEYLLAKQLGIQREFFEKKLAHAEAERDDALKVVENMESWMVEIKAQCESLKTNFEEKQQAYHMDAKKARINETKLNKALSALSEEATMNKLLRSEREAWKVKVDQLEMLNASMRIEHKKMVDDLNEQIRDLAAHFDAQAKIQESAVKGGVTTQELQEGHVVVQGGRTRLDKRKKRTK